MISLDLIMLSENLAAFMEIDGKFYKMQGFSKLDILSVPEVYARKYINNDFKSVTVTGGDTKISYAFDRMKNFKVHDVLSRIADLNLSGDKATVKIVLVDFDNEQDGKFYAVKQSFAVVCKDVRPEDGFLDYFGMFISSGKASEGAVTSCDGFETADFTEKRRGILCD